MSAASLTLHEVQERIAELGDWFHNIDLGGVHTAPDHFLGDYPAVKWCHIQSAIPSDLRGKTVLDIGCNGGFYSIEMKRRGASKVVAIDSDARYLKQAEFAAHVCDVNIDFRQMDVYDVPNLQEQFDIVLFMGVFYHLRHPLLALDLLSKYVVRDKLVFQSLLRGTSKVDPLKEDYPFSESEIFKSAGYPSLYFVEHRYSNDPTNWWIPNRACVEAMLRSSGFVILEQPEDEVYICSKRSPNG